MAQPLVIGKTYGLGSRTALWPDRWPLIAKEECISIVEAAPRDEKERTRWQLPCETCELNTACLTAKQKELGGVLYDREIRTRPRAAASSLFPFEKMQPMLQVEMQLVPYWRPSGGDEERYAVCTGWDIAWSEKSGGDWMAKFTTRYDRRTGKKRILDIDRWQRLGFDEQIDLIEESWLAYRDDLVVVEDAFAQKVWIQRLKSSTAVPVIGHGAVGKGSFQDGVPSLLMDVERRVWEIPFAPDGLKHDMVKIWLSEAEAFGWNRGKLEGVGQHDDTVMSWWHSDWGLRRLIVPGMREWSFDRSEKAVEI